MQLKTGDGLSQCQGQGKVCKEFEFEKPLEAVRDAMNGCSCGVLEILPM